MTITLIKTRLTITEPDFKNLNKNDIEEIYLLIMKGKVPDYAKTGLLWSLSVFIRSSVIWERVHDFQLRTKSYKQKVNLTTLTISFLEIEMHEMFSIIYEPVHGIIYKNSKKEKRVMRHLEIHKFCDATLNKVLEGLKSYNNDVKYGYIQRDITKDEVEYLKLFKEEIEDRLKYQRQMKRWESDETATYGKIWDNEDVHDIGYVETEFLAIVFNYTLTSKATLSCEPTISSLNDEIDFRVSFDESDDEDCMEPTVYNNAPTSKSDLLTEPALSPQHIDEFNLKDKTSLSEYDEKEQNVLYFNDLFLFNVIYPDDLKSDKDNDNDKINIEQPSGDMSVIPLPNAVEKRFGGNAATKKIQRNLLKQQYKNFTASNSKVLDQTFDMLQKFISQLEIHGESISQEDVNQKFSVTRMEHSYNFNTAHGVFAASSQVNTVNSSNIDNLSDDVICAFLASQPSILQLVNEDLEQIYPDDLEKMDLKWQMAMWTMRARRFLKKIGSKLTMNGNETIGFDKSNVECYNCHKRGHFARECRAPRNQENNNRESTRRTVPVETHASSALVSCDGLGVSEPTVKKHVVKTSKAKASADKPKDVRKNFGPPFIEDLILDSEDEAESKPNIEKKTVKPSFTKIKFVKSKEQVKSPRKTTVKHVEKPRQHTHRPRGNQRNWNNMMSQRLGSNFEMYNKAFYGNPQQDLQEKGVIDSGCSRHMTGDMSYLTDYEEINRGYVAFGGGLTCLFAKATSDESRLWHRRLGHLNFKTMNKLVKENLLRGLPSKIYENEQRCVACQKGKQHRASCDGPMHQDTMRDTSAHTRVISFSDDEALDKEDTSKQGRIDDLYVDEDIALVSTHDDVVQDKGIEDFGEEEVVEVVTIAKMLIDTVIDVAQVTTALTITAKSTKTNAKDKGKRNAKLIEEPEMPKKRKHQIKADKELAKKLQAEINKEDRLARERERLLKQTWKAKHMKSLKLSTQTNKPEIKTLSLDGLFNNKKDYESEVMRTSSLTINLHNIAFLSFSSTNSSTRAVNTAQGVNTVSTQGAVDSSTTVENIKEMDLRWNIAMLTMWAKRFLKNTGRKLDMANKERTWFDKSKVECFNCHKRGHFGRECRAPRNQDNRNMEPIRKILPIEATTLNALVVIPPPYTGNFMPPKPDLVYPSLDDFVDMNEYVVEKPTVESNERKTVRKENRAPIIEDLVSENFKLTDESHLLLKVPRKDNRYGVDLKNVVPQGGLICLFAKAASDESNLWHGRLEHVNFKTINKLVKGNLVRGLHNKTERKNKTVIEAARTMLVDSKLPTTFWAEAVNTACYVQNRVLVIKPYNKTPYEIFLGRKLALSFMRPFGYPVTIFNTTDHLGNQSNGSTCTKACDNVGKTRVDTVLDKDYILLPLWTQDLLFSSSSKDSLGAVFKPSGEEEKKDAEDPGKKIVSPTDNAASIEDNAVDENIVYGCADDPNIPDSEEINRFSDVEDDDSSVDMNNLVTYFQVSPVPTTRIHKDHTLNQVIRDLQSYC
nr:ribonuclease H-like domain-containing protein [Tanacetum cinerariifolium]